MMLLYYFIPFSAIDPGAIAAIAAALLGAGGIGGFAAYRKAGKEAESISVQTMVAVNEELRREIARRDEQLKEAKEELTGAKERIAVLESELHRVEAAVTQLQRESKARGDS